MGSNNIWADTARRVAVYQRAWWQDAAARHPVLFALAWLVKAVLVDVPILLTRSIASLVRACRNRPGRELVPVAETGRADG